MKMILHARIQKVLSEGVKLLFFRLTRKNIDFFLDGVMVKDVRRCSARRALRIHGFAPHRSRNIYMDYVSTVQKDKCRCYRLREIS